MGHRGLGANELNRPEQYFARQTLVRASLGANPSSCIGDIPPALAEHPRCEIVRLIGKGGMGDVYEAIDRKMERRVALKVINRDLFRKTEAVNRFHREVNTAAQLSHPNIVTAFDADQADDFHFMVMEFVGGADLAQIVKDQGALPVADACDYIRQAAIGLQHAHERGMVHRDILVDVIVMADTMMDIGYPVDALMSLCRIDASFGNVYGGDDTWARQTAPTDLYAGIDEDRKPFRAAQTKAEQGITVQSVIDAVDTSARSKSPNRAVAGDDQ